MKGTASKAARAGTALAALALLGSAPAAAQVSELQNYSKVTERERYITKTPEFQARLARQNVDGAAEIAAINATDPERGPFNVCATRQQECAGDVRFYEWEESGAGRVADVLWTARSGATISGRVWATAGGPEQRPGVVITTGSVQAPETLYWGIAAALAKHGYVVLTYDVQGQGRSDTLGEAPDEQEGVPSQAGQPFFDGTEDALDFLLSTPTDPYDPRPSCGNANGGAGTDHSPKQERRVAAGLNAAFNPFWKLVDPERIGIAGHSLGAGAVSYVGQIDPRVDAIVAWDNLRAPTTRPECPSGSAPRPQSPPITKPALGMSNDYGLVATPNFSQLQGPHATPPDPQSANGGFLAYKQAGVDSMQVNTRGGTHYEYSFIPGNTVPPLGFATLRGMDMATWYTIAWLDKHVACQGDPECEAAADARLLTDRWRADPPGAAVDPTGDGNLYSFYLRSRFDFERADGAEVVCDDMRSGCPELAADGLPVPYTQIGDAFGPDPAGGGGGGGGGAGSACALPQRGGPGDDTPRTLPPTEAGDAIRGGAGDDRLRGLGGDDCLYGQRGADRLFGEQGADRLRGGEGRDRLFGGEGRDRLRGGRGRDRLFGAPGRDVLACGRGRDFASGEEGDRIRPSCERVAFAIAEER